MRSVPRARRNSGYRAESPNRLSSPISERNIIDVAQSENCTHVNFRLCDVYYVVRPAKPVKSLFCVKNRYYIASYHFFYLSLRQL